MDTSDSEVSIRALCRGGGAGFMFAAFSSFEAKSAPLAVETVGEKATAYLGLRGMREVGVWRWEGVSGGARALTCAWERVWEKDEQR